MATRLVGHLTMGPLLCIIIYEFITGWSAASFLLLALCALRRNQVLMDYIWIYGDAILWVIDIMNIYILLLLLSLSSSLLLLLLLLCGWQKYGILSKDIVQALAACLDYRSAASIPSFALCALRRLMTKHANLRGEYFADISYIIIYICVCSNIE